jgi:hypothetical protein
MREVNNFGASSKFVDDLLVVDKTIIPVTFRQLKAKDVRSAYVRL